MYKKYSRFKYSDNFESRKLDIDLSLRPNQLNENGFYRVEYYEKYKKNLKFTENFLFFFIRIFFQPL